MEPLSLDEVAAAAGVSHGEAQSFVTRGVLRPDEHAAFRPPDIARVRLALDAAAAARAAQLWPLHVGVNIGPLVHRDGDLYGTTVNVASRVADHAGPGEVVVTGNVVDAYGGDDVAFSPIGAVSLKNVGEPAALVAAERVPG